MIPKIFRLQQTESANEYAVEASPGLGIAPFRMICETSEEAEFILTQFNAGSLQIPLINSDCFEDLSTFDDLNISKFSLKNYYILSVTDESLGTEENFRNLSWSEALALKEVNRNETKTLLLEISQPAKSITATRKIIDSEGQLHNFKFEWDEKKSKLNKENHDLDFFEIIDLFAKYYLSTIQEENTTHGREQITLEDKNGKVWRIVFVISQRSHNGFPEHYIRIITGHRHRR